MGKIQFDPSQRGGLELARAIVFQRLREDQSWNQYDHSGQGFDRYVEYVGDTVQGRHRLVFLTQDILWELMIQGVLAPGLNVNNPNLPFFHITDYGKKVLSEGKYLPHDPTGYLDLFQKEVKTPDPTVMRYLSESLECFSRGNLIASIVMLGVASERMFLLLCQALQDSISDSNEKREFEKILDKNAIKPKMDWILAKIQKLQQGAHHPFPDNVNVMLITIFDFVRCQRNDLGHPQDNPPHITIEDAYVNLRVFPSYCRISNEVIEYLHTHKV